MNFAMSKNSTFSNVKVIDVAKVIAPIVGSRDIIKILEKEMNDKAEKIILDFKDVEFISRSAAHSLLCYKRANLGKNIEFVNMNPSVSMMLKVVEAQLNRSDNNRIDAPNDFDVVELIV